MKIKSNNNNGRTDSTVASDGVTTFKELRIASTPTTPDSVVNKAYVDKIAIEDKYLPGSIILRSTPASVSGFLRCNGGELSKNLYPRLHAAIGDAHNVYSVPGAGVPWRHQFGINKSLNSPLDNWVKGTNLPATNMNFQVVVTKNKLYVLGRNNGSSYAANCYEASIDSKGVIGTWYNSSISLPIGLSDAQLFTHEGKVYLVGGMNGARLATVFRSTIDSNGNLLPFQTLASMPMTIVDHQCTAIRNKIFIAGGYINDVASASIYTTLINPNGTLGVWMDHTTDPTVKPFPYPVAKHAMTVANRIGYLIGGLVNGTTPTNEIHCSAFDDSGVMHDWKECTPFPETVYDASVIVSNQKVYVIGGYMSGVITNKIYYADIRIDGSLGAWQPGGLLPLALTGFKSVITSNRVYILGGYRPSTVENDTYFITYPGGLNDYSPYYNGTIDVTPGDKFRLPDYTSYETSKLYAYMKY